MASCIYLIELYANKYTGTWYALVISANIKYMLKIKLIKIFGVTKMKKTAIALALMATAGTANAALVTGSTMSFTAASSAGLVQPAAGTGSWFGMAAGDFNFDGIVDTVHTPISSFDGIVIGSVQTPSGSHTGLVNGTESPTIDNPWGFFQNTGMHGTLAAITVSSDDGAGNVTLDMSGWTVDWNGGLIDMGQGADAVVTCSGTCGDGDTYTLDYSAVVPTGSFTGVPYSLHLEGTISAVPVPAAVWLFGSGLVGLAGIARRRKAA